jgi:hypothetical protein
MIRGIHNPIDALAIVKNTNRKTITR